MTRRQLWRQQQSPSSPVRSLFAQSSSSPEFGKRSKLAASVQKQRESSEAAKLEEIGRLLADVATSLNEIRDSIEGFHRNHQTHDSLTPSLRRRISAMISVDDLGRSPSNDSKDLSQEIQAATPSGTSKTAETSTSLSIRRAEDGKCQQRSITCSGSKAFLQRLATGIVSAGNLLTWWALGGFVMFSSMEFAQRHGRRRHHQ